MQSGLAKKCSRSWQVHFLSEYGFIPAGFLKADYITLVVSNTTTYNYGIVFFFFGRFILPCSSLRAMSVRYPIFVHSVVTRSPQLQRRVLGIRGLNRWSFVNETAIVMEQQSTPCCHCGLLYIGGGRFMIRHFTCPRVYIFCLFAVFSVIVQNRRSYLDTFLTYICAAV